MLDDALEIRTGPLGDDGDPITATLSLRIRPEATIDTGRSASGLLVD